MMFLLPPLLLLSPPLGRSDPVGGELALLLVGPDAVQHLIRILMMKRITPTILVMMLNMRWITADRCLRLSSISTSYSTADELEGCSPPDIGLDLSD